MVSALCITFARPHLLREAVESFLRQDYEGKKELIILNDFDEQKFSINHPEVCIVNLDRKFKTLGEKRNAIAGLAKGEVYFPWDDDDISLPFRISQSINHMVSNKQHYYKPRTAFFWNNDAISSIEINNFHAQCSYTRELHIKAGGYPFIGSGEDQAFDNSIRKILGHQISTNIPAEDNYYLYRWAGTGSYHISALDQKTGENDLFKSHKAYAKIGIIDTGKIEIKPFWNQDYQMEATEYTREMD